MVWFYFYAVCKASKICCQTMLFSCGSTRCLLYQRANELLSASNMNVLHALQKSNVIYQFSCNCESRNVGRTSERMQDRIKQDVPKSIRFCSSSQKRLLLTRRQARRQGSVTGGGGGGAELNFWGARKVYLCKFERGMGAQEFYPSLDQMNKVKTKNSKGFSGRNQKFKRFFRPKTGDLQKKGLH